MTLVVFLAAGFLLVVVVALSHRVTALEREAKVNRAIWQRVNDVLTEFETRGSK